jgi:hypothetical protein
MEGSSREDKLKDGRVEDIAPVSAGAYTGENSREVEGVKLVAIVQDGRRRRGCGQGVTVMCSLVC